MVLEMISKDDPTPKPEDSWMGGEVGGSDQDN
jgi:hypothetical protein